MTEQNKFETWAVVEVMGHRRHAGFVSELTIGGTSFIRVDVPEVVAGGETLPAFTKILGAQSIYAMTPCTEETARAFAAMLQGRAFNVYEAPRLQDLRDESSDSPYDCESDRTWQDDGE